MTTFSIARAARYLGVSHNTMDRLCACREIDYYRRSPHGWRRFTVAQLEAYLTTIEIKAAPRAIPPPETNVGSEARQGAVHDSANGNQEGAG
jgi:hypothetical protein